MNTTRYLIQILSCAAVVAAIAAACNYVVDPYGINNSPRLTGINAYKVDINAHARLLKKYQPGFARYDTLIVGKSRVEMGIDPEHSCFVGNGMQVYNLGVPGAQLSTQLAYAVSAIYDQPIERVFLSVDFTDYISTRQSRLREFPVYMRDGQGSLKYLPDGALNEAYRRQKFRDYFRALFSLDALVSSVKTIALQGGATTDRDSRGFNPGLDFAEMVRVEGANALFAQKLVELRGKYGKPWFLRDQQGQVSTAFDDLSGFLDFAIARGIEVHVFANPLHEAFWDLMREHGHMALYEDWLQVTTDLLTPYADRGVSFWDFSGPTPYNAEPIPAPGERSGPLQWFWEPSHYRRELGDLMLDAMLAERCGTQAVFGRRVM